MAPLEGMSDLMREDVFRGGIPNPSFHDSIASVLPGRNKVEDFIAMCSKIPPPKAYLNDKRADMKKIKVPAYIGASYSSTIHTIGSLRAFEEIPHKTKW
jgi:predicted acyl esterase